MVVPKEPLRFLTYEEMDTIHRNALRILSEIGMKIDHEDALESLYSMGCSVDKSSRIVKFPADMIQNCVDRMRTQYKNRQTPEGMAVRYSQVKFRQQPFGIHEDFTVSAGGFCAFIYDLDGKRRLATLQDVRDSLKIVSQLDQITYSGLPVAAGDVPVEIRPIAMVAELVKATDKLGGIEVFDKFDVEYICRIGEVVRGGHEELMQNPVLIGYAETRTPLCFDYNMCDVFIEYIKRGMPQVLDTMPNAGATAPMHPSGVLALGTAETLAGLALAYSIDQDACVGVDITPSFADMSTGIFKYGGAERSSLLGARLQLISEYYGCPSGIHGGKTDSLTPDIRCGLEKGISMIMPVLCGAIGIGTVGHIENALTFSPTQLLIDNEVARFVRRCVKGFDVSDESINVDLIKRVGIGGNYLAENETAEQFRDFLNLSQWFSVKPWGSQIDVDDAEPWNTMAHEKVLELLKQEVESPLSLDQAKNVDSIVEEARAKLVEAGRL